MDYKTGSYIMRARKVWNCKSCEKDILIGVKCFVRINEYGEELLKKDGEKYRLKTYKRHHINCANQLSNLNEYEKDLITKNINLSNNPSNNNVIGKCKWQISESTLKNNITQVLISLEKEHRLTYLITNAGVFRALNEEKRYFIGRKGFSDIIIFPKNKSVLFIELKIENHKYLNQAQKIFKEKINNLGYNYHIVSSRKELYNLFNTYNI